MPGYFASFLSFFSLGHVRRTAHVQTASGLGKSFTSRIDEVVLMSVHKSSQKGTNFIPVCHSSPNLNVYFYEDVKVNDSK